MNDWLAQLTTAVSEAAAKTKDLPTEVVPGFDGNGWIWLWRLYVQEATRVVEVRFRARPDSLDRGIQVEVSASAWMVQQREQAWACTYWADYVSEQFFSLEDSRKFKGFIDRLSQHLDEAWKGASSAVHALESIGGSRKRVMDALRARNIPVEPL